jgi:hypothetical protein
VAITAAVSCVIAGALSNSDTPHAAGGNVADAASSTTAIAAAIMRTRALMQRIQLRTNQEAPQMSSRSCVGMLEVCPAASATSMLVAVPLSIPFSSSSSLNLTFPKPCQQVVHLQPHVRAWAEAARGSLQRISTSLQRSGRKLFAIGNVLEVAVVQGAVKQSHREEVAPDVLQPPSSALIFA